jgi:hypothetical protein
MAEMSIKEILSNDLKNNYPPGAMTVDGYAQLLSQDIQEGAKLFREGNLLVVCIDLGGGVVELHVINGGHKTEDLVKRVFKVFIQLKQDGFKEIQIPYDKKQLGSIIATFPIFPVTTEKVDEGEGRTYLTTVRLA